MSWILVASILIRIGAMCWSVVLMRRVRDLRMAFLTAMLALMGTRQILTLVATLRSAGSREVSLDRGLTELPGLLVSVLAALAVYHLERFIRQHRRDTEALLQRDRLLQQAQKMEAIGQLAGGVAHDFNNLLTVIRSNAELARLNPGNQEDLEEQMSEIEAAVGRAAALTRQLLSFTRQQARELRLVDCNEVLLEMRTMLRRLLPERVELVFLLAEKLPRVNVDSTQIGQVVINLVVNAQDAIQDEGSITLRTRARGDSVELSVIDNGVGMAEETMRRAFDPMFTTKGLEGTGLGLSICRGIAEEHGGHLEVESRLGHGSTFTLTIPGSEAAVAKRFEVPLAAPGGDELIVVVEDETQVRKVTCSMLLSLGYRVMESVNGADALRLLETQPGVALVLADVMMPQMGGVELRSRMSRLHPGLPVLLMSGYTDAPIDDDAAVVAKPFSRERLARKVRACLDQGSRDAPSALGRSFGGR